ncbi:zinc finger E-box-binding homeobox 1 [Triplophysa rosa]|uniref:Zinc finger E-box-binding homeobox 1 n=1 Tax=Triplophysa rosa TaxID=992332 RepID=A0A9W8C755_TRIRA|nr:zinc finger E-box-binding homeobox 1 [Triplophysa rosa]KAI7809172.1 putative zinc finger E-box-binding homeobox 1 [Triplophysa rosa]
MADGPRCQRRKQTQPRHNSVRSLRSVPEATSDSDDEDKLHIVEEDSIHDDPGQTPSVFQLEASQQDTVSQDDGSLGPDALIQEIRVKEECVTDEEEDDGADVDVTAEEQQQAEMKAIYPDTPDEHQSTPERGVHDENGTPDAFSHLHTCPHCSRGYKRQTSLKEHIKLRHEKSEDNYCCSLCSYTFTYRTQLVRHMTAHKHIREQRNISQSGGNRKFKCTECSKAFKYKHHLKEHLRIHSGEKPYECSNCQKRFSHSGSYSSHISSKKCASVTSAVNGLSRTPGVKTTLMLSRPTPILLREKVDVTNKPLQEQLPLKQIKQEPVEHQTKPVSTTPTTTNGVVQVSTPQGVVQTLVVPTVGLVQPISINLSDLQNALNAAMDGNGTRPVLVSTNVNGTNAKIIGQVQTPAQPQAVLLQTQPQQQVISAFSVPLVGQDGNAKIIINYNPQLHPQLRNAAKAKTTQSVVEQSTVTKPVEEQTDTAQVKYTVSDVAQPTVAQGLLTQSNVTETQTSLNPKPTQVSIVRPIQVGNSSKPASIIKITPAQAARLVQARAVQPKFTQQTLLLVRRADGTQSLVVRQVAVANPNTQGTPAVETKATEVTSTPEKPVNMVISPEEKETTENTSLEEVSKLENIKIKTEPESPSKPETEMEADGEKDTHTDGNKEEGKQTTVEDKLTVSHSGTVHSGVACGDNFHNYATCLVCDNSPGKRNGIDCLNGEAKGSPTTISLTSLLDKDKSGAAERLLPLLKAYSQNPQPTEEQLSQVAKIVRLPLEAVSKWYQRMRSKRILLQGEKNLKKNQERASCDSTQDTCTPANPPDNTSTDVLNGLHSATPSPVPSPTSVSTEDLKVIVKTEDVEEELQSEPLDLSLPKSSPAQASVTTKLPISAQKEPLNLTCLKKQEFLGNTIYVAQTSTGPINIMATSLQTLVAIAEPGHGPCIGATVSGNKRTILIPQLTYTYNSNVKTTDSTAVNTKGMVVLNSCLKVTDATTDSVSAKEDQNDEASPVQKKRKKISGGLYACNLCDKIFQKSSSLLRHKYEHTGKRPYECGICQKAFKHKHHLIEHTRLHSGEKPYQCDKCGKRFSHSGSYSQHMNHRYSYCKKESNEHPEPNSTPTPPSHLDSDDRESDGEEEEDLSGLDMSDIRVVRIGEEYDEEEESGGEEKQGNTQEETEEGETVMEVELRDIGTLEEEVWETMETEDAMETEESMEESGYGEGDLNHEENAEVATEEEQND